MGVVGRSGAAVAIAAVTGATVLATPVERPAPAALAGVTSASEAVGLTASSQALYSWPLLLGPDWVARLSGGAGPTVTSPAAGTLFASTADPMEASVEPTVSSRALSPRPAVTAPNGNSRQAGETSTATSTAAALAPSDLDAIDDSFIDLRIAVRTDFTAFANQLGYLGKQLYIAFNFAESIVASFVFNGTDILRGEGLFTNLGEIGRDIFESAYFVVLDEIVLIQPGTPIAISRPPLDRPIRWRDAQPPHPTRPLSVPPNYDTSEAASQALVVEDSTGTDDVAAPAEDAGTESVATEGAPEVDDSSDTTVLAAENTRDAGRDPSVREDLAEPDEADEPEAGEPEAGEPEAGEPEAGEPEAGEPEAASRTASKSKDSESGDKGSDDTADE